MIGAQLAAAAKRQQALREDLSGWRLRGNLSSFLRYLYWRNRYPILTKLLGRAAIFLEFYLLLLLFHQQVAFSFSLLFFFFFLSRGLFMGVGQYFRVVLVRSERDQAGPATDRLLSTLALLSVIYGLSVPALPLFYLLSHGYAAWQVAYCAVWLLILPLEYTASAAWLAVYTQHRLRRNFWLICLWRLLPAATLLLLHSELGPYAYILGLAVGRGGEQLYLLSLGITVLRQRGFKAAPFALARQSGQEILKQGRFWRYALTTLPLQGYLLSLALLIAARESELWLTHFVFSFLVLSLAYPALRAPNSLFMDLFLALKFGDLAQARWWLRRGTKALIIVLVLTLAAALLLAGSPFVSFRTPVFYELSLYLLLALTTRALFMGAWTWQRAAAMEYRLTLPLALLFGGLTLLQAWLLIYWRANLPAVYLVESLALLAALPLLFSTKHWAQSPFYQQDFVEGLKRAKLLPPLLWLQNFKGRAAAAPMGLLALQLDARYRTETRQLRLLEEIVNHNLLPDIGTKLGPDLYLYLIPSGSSAAQGCARSIQLAFGGHVRNAVVLDPSRPFSENALILISAVEKVRVVPRRLRGTLQELRLLINNKTYEELEQRLTEGRPEALTPERALDIFEQTLRSAGLAGLPRIRAAGPTREASGAVTGDLLRFAHHSFGPAQGARNLLPALRRPFAVFYLNSQPLLIVDSRQLAEVQSRQLYALSLCLSLVLTQPFTHASPFQYPAGVVGGERKSG